MTLLYWFIVLLIIGLVAFLLPTYGGLARLQAWRDIRHREQIEDALKHLLDREQQGRHASPESLAGALGISTTQVMKLIADMSAQHLVEQRGLELHLTGEGERWALHVVRAHRLWERYLADEARMPLQKVHDEAQRREHTLSPAELDALDAALGFPSTDPHGDPIPTSAGQLARQGGRPLTAWETDEAVRIVHLEDEPAIAYQQITAAGLRLGQTIRILEKTPARYILSDGENEYRLAPAVAANIHVVPLAESERMPGGVIPLWQLPHNQRAEIVALDEGVQGFTRRRFLDLGLTPGTLIAPELQNFFGDPRGYRVRGTLIALRKDQADQIWVKPLEQQ
ncbi:MAG: iron dependent repressor, metal binding and dimerization domain protein [Anaerolineales bacterium]